MMLRVLVVVGIINVGLLPSLTLPLLLAALVLAGIAGYLANWGHEDCPVGKPISLQNPFELRVVLEFGALLAVIMAATKLLPGNRRQVPGKAPCNREKDGPGQMAAATHHQNDAGLAGQKRSSRESIGGIPAPTTARSAGALPARSAPRRRRRSGSRPSARRRSSCPCHSQMVPYGCVWKC
jgi:hypothetical protein